MSNNECHNPITGSVWIEFNGGISQREIEELIRLGRDIDSFYKNTGVQTGVICQLLFYTDGAQLRYRSVTWDSYKEIARSFLDEKEIERLEVINERNRDREKA